MKWRSLSAWAVMMALAGVLSAAKAGDPAFDVDTQGKSPPMMKSIYLTRGKAGFTHDQFVIRWRQHGALAMSKRILENMATYVQAEIIKPSPLAGTTQDYDGIAYIRTRDHERQPFEDVELGEMAKDELLTFGGIIAPRLIVVEEKAIKPGPNGGATAFLFFKDAGVAAMIADQYGKGDFSRVLLDVRRHGAGLEGMSALIPYEAVVEVSSPSTAALAHTLGAAKTAPWRKADLAAITRETLMWERPLAAPTH